MPGPQLYIIDYQLHGKPRSFIIRLETLDNAEAWHWASCDAGIGIIPKFGREKNQESQQADGRALRDYRGELAGIRR
ncbi:hypothetical protein PPS11_29861 [Pseudomonas putida S11]|nr:hypothetical protein PPS11_29861 [Pseudomonas putida S11]